MAITKEELDEIAALEAEEQHRRDELADEAKRQHLEALRLVKRLAPKHGTPGRDFVVVETTLGNVAVRRPTDVEMDLLEEKPDDRATQERFAAGLVIEPQAVDLQKLMAQHAGLAGPLCVRAMSMLKVIREEEAKK